MVDRGGELEAKGASRTSIERTRVEENPLKKWRLLSRHPMHSPQYKSECPAPVLVHRFGDPLVFANPEKSSGLLLHLDMSLLLPKSAHQQPFLIWMLACVDQIQSTIPWAPTLESR